MIVRNLEKQINERFGKGKAILIIGPRQVGKTTLINKILHGRKHLFFDGDDPYDKKILTNPNTEELKSIIGSNDIIFIDEAQRIENIGITLKLITDQIKPFQLIISGSSALELNNRAQESLTGRKWEYKLFPISWHEFEKNVGYKNAQQQLQTRIVYGMYPEVINNLRHKNNVLKELLTSYLYKDVFTYSGIRKSDVLDDLVQALAYQIGNEVNYNELSRLIGINSKTVQNYINLLCQTYIVFKLPSFSKNLRTEIRTNHKIYFYDTGIRNMVIGNLNPLELRQDKGALWENFLISERLKYKSYIGSLYRGYFWRTTRQQEIDYVEREADKITGFEIKWKEKSNVKISKTFTSTYNAEVKVVNNENFREFLI